MANTGRGPRVTVRFSANGKEGVVAVKLTTATFFGLRPTRVVKQSRNGRRYRVRGETGGKQFKVLLFDGNVQPPTNGESSDEITTIQIPAPSNFTIDDIIAVTQTWQRNRPRFIVSPDGRWYSADGGAGLGGFPTLPGLPGNPFNPTLPGGNLGSIGGAIGGLIDIIGSGPQGGVLQLP